MKTAENKILNFYLSFWLFLFTLPLSSTCFSQGADLTDQPRLNLGPDPPVYFEQNVGQADSAAKFLARGCHANVFLTPTETWLNLGDTERENEPSRVLRLGLAGANPKPELAGVNALPGRVNYFIGNNPADWHANVPVFAQVKYREIYPGVDLIYHGNHQQLECDFVVQPGADPHRIALEFSGAGNMSIEPEGNLLLPSPEWNVHLRKPVAYQEFGGSRTVVPANFVLCSGGRVGFQVGHYDNARPLVIDPVLAYSFTFGGNGGPSQGLGIALDTNHDVYTTGNTMAPNFPIASAYQTNFTGSQDVFISEFNTNGMLVFSTFLGGSGIQSGQGVAVDIYGNIFVAGYTSATNFPTHSALQPTNGGGYDGFVTELRPGGDALAFSTYLGGNGFDAVAGITLDTNDSPVITGYTQSTNFPTANAAQPAYGGNGDAFVAKLNSAGSALVYSTYLGGNDSEDNGPGTDIDPVANQSDVLAHLGGAVAVDREANAYVTGWTYSTNFPVVNAYQRTNNVYNPGSYTTPFVSKLDPSGNLIYSTYFGGGYGDVSRAVGVDFNNNVYFAGSWYGFDLPVTNAFDSG
ncbi:MAG TPA: SBBP repeat-containing protein, partial [Verrucomicrobiae bacterium]|nr:SBBP repeat-containing protein [Verrucomicrobiae bacterium]